MSDIAPAHVEDEDVTGTEIPAATPTVEDSSAVSSFSRTTVTGKSSRSSASVPPPYHRDNANQRRVSRASADLAELMTSFARGQHVISYDTPTSGRGAGGIRQTLNETIYELMLARVSTVESVTAGEALRISTSETPFVNPPVTGDDAVDAFVSERTARAEDGAGIDFDVKNDDDDDDEKGGSWQNSSAWKRGLKILLLTLFLVAMFHVAGFLFLLLSTEVFEHPYACKTRNCMQLTEWVQEGLDNKTNPCDNFYNFSCGNYKKNVHINRGGYARITDGIPFEYISNEALGRLLHRVHGYPLDQILPFYHSCINEDERNRVGVQPFIDLLLHLKLMEPVTSARMDIARTIIRIYRMINKRIFIDTYSTRENFIVVNLCPPEKEYSLSSSGDYVDAIRNAFRLLKTELNIEDDNEIETIAYLLIHFEAELVYIQSKKTSIIFGYPFEESMDAVIPKPKSFHPNYIPSQTGFFHFDSLVAALFSHQRNLKNMTIFFNYLHSITKQDDRLFMVFLEELLNRTPYYVLLRYFQWALIKHFRVDLTTSVYETMIPIFRDMGYTPDERCFRSMFSKLHVLAATRFSKELSNLPYLDTRIAEVIGNIWTVLRNLTEGLPPSMVEYFKETFSTFAIVKTAISDFEPHIDVFYKGLEMNKNRYFENVIQAASLKAENDLKKFQNIPPFHLWPLGDYSIDDITVTTVQNAGGASRFLYIPFGALQQPFLGNDIPIFDLSGFGFYIGAFYMMHYAIGDFLAYHVKDREAEEPETVVIPQKQMAMELLPKLECILDDYRRTIAHMRLEKKADPTALWGRVKNLAFIAAVELILETLDQYPNMTQSASKNQILLGLEKYSPDQLFLMALTRHTCKAVTPDRRVGMGKRGSLLVPYMINTAFRNSEHFSKVWQCSPRRFMNPRRKCKFFNKMERPSAAPPLAPPSEETITTKKEL